MKEYNWREERKKYQTFADKPQHPAAPAPEQVPIPVKKSHTGLFVVLAILLTAGITGVIFYLTGKKQTVPYYQTPLPEATQPAASQPVSAAPTVTVNQPNEQLDDVVKPQINFYNSPVDDSTIAKISEYHKNYPWYDHLIKWLHGQKIYGVICEKNTITPDMWGTKLVPSDEIKKSQDMSKIFDFLHSTWNFFRSNYNYTSYDNKNSLILVYYPLYWIEGNEFFSNAFACPKDGKHCFAFSPGEGEQKIVTHEFTHAVTYNSNFQNLIFSQDGINFYKYEFGLEYSGESGALNEGFSDIFACLHYIEKHKNSVGDDRWQATPYRLLSDPTKYQHPAQYRDQYWGNPELTDAAHDFGYVHHNSTVFSRLAFLLCDGQSADPVRNKHAVQAIGFEQTKKLFWYLLTGKKLTYTQGFSDLASKILSSAQECDFSVQEQQSVIDACREAALPGSELLVPQTPGLNLPGLNLPGLKYASKMSVQEIRKYRIRNKNDFCKLFSNVSARSVNIKHSTDRKYTYYSTMQHINGIPVYGSMTSVSTDRNGNIQSLNCASSALSSKSVFKPKTADTKALAGICKLQRNHSMTMPVSMIYDPKLLNTSGEARLVWMFDVKLHGNPVKRYFVNQHDMRIVRIVPLTPPMDPEKKKWK